MNYSDWKIHYDKILDDFGYSRVEDERATVILSNLLHDKRDETALLEDRLLRADVVCFGRARSLVEELRNRYDEVLIAADGATSALLHEGLIPDIITTDLDGHVPDQIVANQRGSLVVAHAHGDNIPLLEEWIPLFPGPILGSTQGPSMENVHNFGGFTDGDRAVCLAHHFGARTIRLVGFDFQEPNAATESDMLRKKKKLDWAFRIIRDLDIPIDGIS